MYLSYSGYKTYTACPCHYWHKYIDKTRLDLPDNRVNTLFGTVVGSLFEYFYNEKIWAEKGVEQKLRNRVQTAYLRAIAKETRSGSIKWKPEDEKANYASPEELLEDVRATIPRGLLIIRQHRLLGQSAAAEVKLDQEVQGHTIAGRSDFLMRRISPHHDLILLDGKGSKYRDKYIDSRQLRWYAMLHRLKEKHAPDRLGFVYWRSEPEKSVDWLECSSNELDSLYESVLETIAEIEKGTAQITANPDSRPEVFPARPGEQCRFCPYLTLCPTGQKFQSLKAPKHGGTGVEDVGF
jgi:hypothetical protein